MAPVFGQTAIISQRAKISQSETNIDSALSDGQTAASHPVINECIQCRGDIYITWGWINFKRALIKNKKTTRRF